MSDFWSKQSKEEQDRYVQLLQVIGSLSNLFADSANPFLYYRAHENLFCEVFGAKNLSRGDISFDAVKNGLGIGLKTFLQGNGLTFQKIAEFNADSNLFRDLKTDEDIVYKVSELRNKRITMNQNATDTKLNLYHLVTRSAGKMHITETPMDLVDINSIKIARLQNKNTIKFSDRYNDYSFSKSKSTLLKRFDTTQNNIIYSFQVDILDNPFDILYKLSTIDLASEVDEGSLDYIILPLYSPKTGQVPERSGLNQWNARGRERHPDEVYISIPSWIHKTFPDFFSYSKHYGPGVSAKNSPSFQIELPNGNSLKCKVAQAGGKALMSDPNKELGHWILRDVLKMPENRLVTIEYLNELGIDSVKLSKRNDNYYYLDFMESNSFSEFEMNNK